MMRNVPVMLRPQQAMGLTVLMILSLTACAGGISRQARSQVNYFEPFTQLQQQPDRYRGAVVMWGGRILTAVALDGATELEVLHLDLSRGQRPINNDKSQGSFLVRSDGFLDPALYPKGAMVTVVGPLKGSQQRPIGKMAYTFPVIGITEIKKWPPNSTASPSVHFGIGIGTRF